MKNKAFRISVALCAALLSAGVISTPYTAENTGFVVTAEAASALPAAPEGFLNWDIGKTHYKMGWSPVEGAEGYSVYIYDSAKEDYVLYKSVKGTECNITELAPGTVYSFKVASLKKVDGKFKAGKKSEPHEIRTAYEFKAGETVSCDLFSITLPEGVEYEAKTEGNIITIYDKQSVDAGFDGTVFAVYAYENPSDYSDSSKLGEIRTEDGKIYDITAGYPWETPTYDYENNPELFPENFHKLYYGFDDVLSSITAKEGTYVPGGGTKGKELYGDVIKKYRRALKAKWDPEKLEEENMSHMYGEIYITEKCNLLDTIGFAYRDINFDGVDELLIGRVAAEEGEPEQIYDIYTMVDRKPVHVASGWDRNRLYFLEAGYIGNEYSESAMAGGYRVYNLPRNSAELSTMAELRIDTEKDPEQPYYVYYSFAGTDDYTPITEDEFDELADYYFVPAHIHFTPFSSLK